jgi:hypothetical protein
MLIVLGAACALPTDDSAQVVSGENVENVMTPTSTSTTQPVGSTKQREMFFYEDDALVGVEREVPADADIAEILTMLSPTQEDTVYRSTLPEDFVVTTTELDDGILTVVLADDALFNLGGAELARAVAQIALTATQLKDSDITAVRFVLAGEDQARTVQAGPDLADTDDPVGPCDYRQFLPDEDCTPFS